MADKTILEHVEYVDGTSARKMAIDRSNIIEFPGAGIRSGSVYRADGGAVRFTDHATVCEWEEQGERTFWDDVRDVKDALGLEKMRDERLYGTLAGEQVGHVAPWKQALSALSIGIVALALVLL